MEQKGGPEKRIYAITPQGQDELVQWLRSGATVAYQRDEFYVKLMLSLASGVVDPYQVIQSQRSRLYQELHDLTLRRNATDPSTGMAQILLFDKAMMHLEADLRWIDMIESRLDEIRRHPPPTPEPKPRGRPKAD